MEKQVNATFDQDSKHFHRFLIDANNEGIVGNVYIAKGDEIPDRVVIVLKTAREK